MSVNNNSQLIRVCLRIAEGENPGGPCTGRSRFESPESFQQLCTPKPPESCPVCGLPTRILQAG
jgi:hypothetical protein